MGPSIGVQMAVLTDVGMRRTTNQDSHALLAADSPELLASRGHFFMVADGMGGHAGGEEASALAVGTLERFILDAFKWFRHLKGPESDKVLREFRQALGQADATVLAEAAQRPELHGMGTTLTMAYSLNDELFIVHAGDSRCYLLRNGVLHQLTKDHTIVQEMVRRGILEPDEAAHHHLRHVVTNVIGGSEAGVRVEIHKVHLEAGDRVLLCSDGLTEMVPDAEITALLRDVADPASACE